MTDETPPGVANAEPPRKRKAPRPCVLKETSTARDRDYSPPPEEWYRALVRLLKEPVFALSNKYVKRLECGFKFTENYRTFELNVTTSNRDVGFAQITDGDILIFAASKLVDAYDHSAKRGVDSLNATIEFCPYELLATIGRPGKVDGKTLRNLEDALQRLMVTQASFRTGDIQADQPHPLLVRYHRAGKATADNPNPRWSLTVSKWFVGEIAATDLARVVWFNPANFALGKPDLKDGSALEQLVARWAVGYRQYRSGSAVAIKLLRAYKLSGMTGKAKFLDRLEVVVKRNRLPDHTLEIVNEKREGGGDLMIDLRPGKARELPRWRKKPPTVPPRRLDPSEPLIGDGLPDNIHGDASWT